MIASTEFWLGTSSIDCARNVRPARISAILLLGWRDAASLGLSRRCEGGVVIQHRLGDGVAEPDSVKFRFPCASRMISFAAFSFSVGACNPSSANHFLSRVHWVEPKLVAEITYLT